MASAVLIAFGIALYASTVIAVRRGRQWNTDQGRYGGLTLRAEMAGQFWLVLAIAVALGLIAAGFGVLIAQVA